MNERIEELANEAAAIVGVAGSRADFAQKFAELIVRECCNIADEVERVDMDSYVSKYIKAHFGVEE